MAALIGPKKVHRYSLEFKIQAVKLANHPEIQTQDVAHALNTLARRSNGWHRKRGVNNRGLEARA